MKRIICCYNLFVLLLLQLTLNEMQLNIIFLLFFLFVLCTVYQGVATTVVRGSGQMHIRLIIGVIDPSSIARIHGVARKKFYACTPCLIPQKGVSPQTLFPPILFQDPLDSLVFRLVVSDGPPFL